MHVAQYELDNGMNVILIPRSAAPVVACNVWVSVGSADEDPAEAGLAHVHEHMLFKGTERRGVGEIAREVESAGGHINAFTSFDQTCYYVVMSSRHFDTGLDILADAIRNSAFDADELGRELEVIQEEIKRGNDDPHRSASRLLFETAYSEHPYRLPVIGTKESVDSFKREDVVRFFHKHYVPSNMTLVLSGDFDEEQARAMVAEKFGDFEGPQTTLPQRRPEPRQSGSRVACAEQDIQESHLRIAFHVPDVLHEDIPALDLLGAVMGSGDASHLHRVIQRERELVNGVYAGAYTPKDAGIFIVAADYQLGEDTTHESVAEAVLTETFHFCTTPAADADLRRARTLIESREIYGQQTVEGLAMKLGRSFVVTGDAHFDDRYYAALAKVTVDDVRRVAQTYLRPDNCTVTLLRPTSSPEVAASALEETIGRAFEAASTRSVDAGLVGSDGVQVVDVPGGPRLLIQEDHAVPTFALRMLVHGGVRLETRATSGVGALVSELVTKGTTSRTADQIAHASESMASGIGGSAGRNTFSLSMTGLSRFFEPCFEIFADCATNATVPDEEFAREQKLAVQNVRARQDRLGAVNYDRFTTAFFGDHPYAMPVAGSEASLQALTPDAARRWLRSVLKGPGAVLAAVGDVQASRVLQLTEELLRDDSSEASDEAAIAPAPAPERRVVIGDLDKEQAFVTIGYPAPQMGDEARYAMEVLYAVLSGQGGRLFYELRDKQSLAYSVYASMLLGVDVSAFTVNIGTSPEKIRQAVDGIEQQIELLRSDRPSDQEIERAKRYLIGNHDIGLQTNGSRSMSFGLDELYGFGYRKTLDYSDRIDAVSADDIAAFVDQYLRPDAATIAITKPSGVDISIDS